MEKNLFTYKLLCIFNMKNEYSLKNLKFYEICTNILQKH